MDGLGGPWRRWRRLDRLGGIGDGFEPGSVARDRWRRIGVAGWTGSAGSVTASRLDRLGGGGVGGGLGDVDGLERIETICETHTFMILELCVSHMGSTTDEAETLPEPFPETADAIEAADWGDRTATVKQEFEDGGMIVSFDYAGGKYDPLSGGLYYVPPNADDTADPTHLNWYEIRGSYRRDERNRRAEIIGRLNERTGFWWSDTDPADPTTVPLEVATDGQKAIAAYLFGMHRMDTDQIAEKLGKADSTVRQYLSDYKAGRTG